MLNAVNQEGLKCYYVNCCVNASYLSTCGILMNCKNGWHDLMNHTIYVYLFEFNFEKINLLYMERL